MRQLFEIAIAIIIALVLFAAFSYISVYLIQAINVFSLVVIYYAASKGEIHGACLGSVCGLIQDSFSLGVFGVAGIAKTIMGFAAGFVAKRINVLPASRNFVWMSNKYVTSNAKALPKTGLLCTANGENSRIAREFFSAVIC